MDSSRIVTDTRKNTRAALRLQWKKWFKAQCDENNVPVCHTHLLALASGTATGTPPANSQAALRLGSKDSPSPSKGFLFVLQRNFFVRM